MPSTSERTKTALRGDRFIGEFFNLLSCLPVLHTPTISPLAPRPCNLHLPSCGRHSMIRNRVPPNLNGSFVAVKRTLRV